MYLADSLLMYFQYSQLQVRVAKDYKMTITSNSKRKKIFHPQNVCHKCRLSYIAANVHLGLYWLLIVKKIFISKKVFSLENTGLQTVLPGILIIQVQEMVLQGYENLTGRKKQSDFTVKTEFRQHCSRFRPQLLLILYMFLHIVILVRLKPIKNKTCCNQHFCYKVIPINS